MSRLGRLRSEIRAATLAFLRRRTAVFFTFFFPVIIVVIFGVLVQTRPGGGGLFTEPPSYYVPGYLAVVVLFTPLSRVGSEVARHRDGNRFEKLATTPLTRTEWLLAQTAVNVVVIGLAGLLLLFLMVGVTGASIRPSPLLLPFVVLGVGLFCGIGAAIGSLASSQDGVISASNGIALPLLFLSETFVPPTMLPAWLPTWLSPLTYFSRGVRAATTGSGDAIAPLVILTGCSIVALVVAAGLLPRTD
ncbi:ABC transporter permease [Haloarcula halophila]|uniref:ABC transporter permease n=1 Tax=Haloarcula TaxID=2237 RepID=UPI0023E36555|nr:ABC transporter permease [Halomicroarcula sp. DFY41]